MRHGSLFSGGGGLDLAVTEVFGTEPAWVSDIEDGPKLVLAHRFPDAVNLGDIKAIDWDTVERVAITAGGYPRPGESAAGLRLGTDDPRWLWPQYREAIRHIRPRIAIGENVAGHLTKSFKWVVADLLADGYHVTWTRLPASAVGAPHLRYRVFWVAWPAERGAPAGRHDEVPFGVLHDGALRLPDLVGHGDVITSAPHAGVAYDGHAYETSAHEATCEAGELFVTPTAQLSVNGGSQPPEKRKAGGHGPTLADQVEHLLPTPRATDAEKRGPNQRGSSGDLMLPAAVQPARFGPYAATVARWERAIGGPAPNPTEPGRKGGQRLSAEFVEWLMGYPAGWITDTPGITRNQAIRIGGNSVVPQQGAAALRWLLAKVPADVLTPLALTGTEG